jgi:Carboxypeptidase regulatory-like domain
MKRVQAVAIFLVFLATAFSPRAFAQFTGSIDGLVEDSSGAVIPNAKLTLTNDGTGEQRVATGDASGVYTFVSLAPANYHLFATATGFAKSEVSIVLLTGQVLNVPIKLTVGGAAETVQVTTESPILDTADTRVQETLSTQTLSSLPLAGRSMISLVMLSPGVTGTGITSNGSPGSGRDNYSTETQVDASANGQGAVGNQYVVDGLDVTSSIRPGVLNLTPNPDSIQEVSIQTNTYNVDYGRASSVEMLMTTKSGTDRYHGNASDYFTNQELTAATDFQQSYLPFHSNNISATVGGPIVPRHKFGYFFFGIEPLRASQASGGLITFEDPAFTAFASTAFPNTVGTKLLTTYPVSKVAGVTVTSTAADLYPANDSGSPVCGTASTSFLPCSTAIVDTGDYSDTSFRNGLQYNFRLDKDFAHDRLYGSVFRTTLTTNGPNQRAQFVTTNKFYQYAIQINETHTFSPSTLNEGAFAVNRVEGIQPATGLFTVPVVTVQGIGSGFGDGFAQGDFIQHNYHWRDVLTHVFKSHDFRLGYEGLFGDDIEIFNGPYDQPNFVFNSLLDLASDNVYTEGNVAYNPVTGSQDQYNWNAAGITNGVFLQDTWKLNSRFTVNYGLRWDDFGNPYSRSANTAFGNFFLGSGQTEQQQIANGIVVRHDHALNRALSDIFSPRGGVAWNVDGKGKWVIKAGAGIFHNWPSLANMQEEYRGNPPGDIFPTFFGSQGTPVFGFGTSNQKPFNFPYPTFAAPGLNAAGGLTGLQFTLGGINPNLESPVAYIYSGGLEHEIGSHYVVGFTASGSNARKLLSGGGQVYNVSYGQDINEYQGDLIQHNSTVPTRLNQNFGEVLYTANDRVSNYAAEIVSFQGRFSHAFFNASYTHSESRDDTQVFPSYINVHQWYGPSNWDAPNRVSMAWNYQLPEAFQGQRLVGRFTDGWVLSGTTALQSGYPFNVSTNAAFAPLTDSAGKYIGYAPSSGDYSANGDNFDFPDVASYKQGTSHSAFLGGVFTSGNFAQPAFGQGGNEKFNSFVSPAFFQSDVALLKNTRIAEGVSLQLRFEFFNVFNHPNLINVDSNLPDGSFGKATGQDAPRFIQIGGNIKF